MTVNRKAQRGGGPRRLTPQKVVNWLKSWVVHNHDDMVMEKELVDEGFVPKSKLQVVEGERQAVMLLCQENPQEMRGEWTKFQSYLDNGYRAILARVDGKIVGHVWWHDHQLDRASRHPQLTRFGLELKPKEVWSFDLFLLPAYRGGGASNDFFALFRKRLKDAGYAKVYGHCGVHNLPAVWIHKLQGYRPVKTVKGELFCRVLLWSGGRPFVRNPTFGVRQKFDFCPIW